ncbi:MAG TPA: Rrf2 family transcriptional regulator [Rubricoccaceae bacterium]|nr:Rrf2 family transcriptional regulator [Rubricoccaceae bacterium]
MLLSKACEYGVRAALHLAAATPDTYVPIRSISAALGIPYPFLAKVVQTLTQHDVLASSRGAAGGVRLARPAERIFLKEIVLAVDGPAIFHACVLGLPGCGERRPCPLHEQWAPVRGQVEAMFGSMTLGELARRMAAGDFRLTADGGGA